VHEVAEPVADGVEHPRSAVLWSKQHTHGVLDPGEGRFSLPGQGILQVAGFVLAGGAVVLRMVLDDFDQVPLPELLQHARQLVVLERGQPTDRARTSSSPSAISSRSLVWSPTTVRGCSDRTVQLAYRRASSSSN
jgi:hypothetical protein